MKTFWKWFDRLTTITVFSILIVPITVVPLVYLFKFLGLPVGFLGDVIMSTGIAAFWLFFGLLGIMTVMAIVMAIINHIKGTPTRESRAKDPIDFL